MLDDFTDCHAILGVPVDAEFNDIRKRYVKIAQRLHPDSFAAGDQVAEAEKELATQFFSKLVSPAYATFTKERERKEYLLLVQLKGKQAIQQKVPIAQLGELAQQLASAENPEAEYYKVLEILAAQQYQNLAQSLEMTGKISELNLVYLMRRESQSQKLPKTSATSSSPSAPSEDQSVDEAVAAEAKRSATVDSYLRRAEEYMAKKAYAQATLELRDALRFAPNDSRCHSLMGMVYLQQNQTTMAKVSIKRSLELNSQDPIALKAKQQLEKLGQKVDAGQSKPNISKVSQPNKADDKSSGLFGGLFGSKKK